MPRMDTEYLLYLGLFITLNLLMLVMSLGIVRRMPLLRAVSGNYSMFIKSLVLVAPLLAQVLIVIVLLLSSTDFATLRHAGNAISSASIFVKIFFVLMFITRPAFYFIAVSVLLGTLKLDKFYVSYMLLFLLVSILTISSMRSFFDIILATYLSLGFAFNFRYEIKTFHVVIGGFLLFSGGIWYKIKDLNSFLENTVLTDYVATVLVERISISIASYINAVEYMMTSMAPFKDTAVGIFGVALHRFECLIASCYEKDFSTLAKINYDNIFVNYYLLPNSGATPGFFAISVYSFPYYFMMALVTLYVIKTICGHRKVAFFKATIVVFSIGSLLKNPSDIFVFPSEGFCFVLVTLALSVSVRRSVV